MNTHPGDHVQGDALWAFHDRSLNALEDLTRKHAALPGGSAILMASLQVANLLGQTCATHFEVMAPLSVNYMERWFDDLAKKFSTEYRKDLTETELERLDEFLKEYEAQVKRIYTSVNLAGRRQGGAGPAK